MQKKKILRAEDITEKDILSMYERILPLLYDNPDTIDVTEVFDKIILGFISYDFTHYVMMDSEESTGENFSKGHQTWPGKKESKTTEIALIPIISSEPNSVFDELVEQNYQLMIQKVREKFPYKSKEYHYFRIVSYTYPKFAMGFFRYKNKNANNVFTPDDISIFDKLHPHIIQLMRTILNDLTKSRTYQYFDAYSDICLELSRTFKLSSSEAKFIPDILFGYTNEEMAEKYFVSVAAVKKNIKHIFKKTDTKNRIDFISKFFTSPDRINLS